MLFHAVAADENAHAVLDARYAGVPAGRLAVERLDGAEVAVGQHTRIAGLLVDRGVARVAIAAQRDLENT